jgi:hypothetical protein
MLEFFFGFFQTKNFDLHAETATFVQTDIHQGNRGRHLDLLGKDKHDNNKRGS